MTRILSVVPYPVVPLVTGGKIRIASIAEKLCGQGIEVDFLTPFVFGQRTRYRRAGLSMRLRQIPYPMFWALFADKPLPYQYITSVHPGLPWFAKRYLTGYDFVFLEHVQFASLLPFVPPTCKLIYNAHNVEYDYVGCECRALPRWLSNHITRRIRRFEMMVTRRADSVLVVSEEDRQRFAELYDLPAQKTFLVPNGIQDQDTQGSRAELKARLFSSGLPDRIWVFSGSDVAHNRDAVEQLMNYFVPPMPENHALVLHGQIARHFRRRGVPARVFFDEDGNFADYGEVDAVGLNPIRLGSGTNLKLLHYLAHGLRAITTPFGLRGMGELGKYVLSAPVEDFWCAANSRDIPKPPQRDSLQSIFGWSQIVARLADHLTALR